MYRSQAPGIDMSSYIRRSAAEALRMSNLRTLILSPPCTWSPLHTTLSSHWNRESSIGSTMAYRWRSCMTMIDLKVESRSHSALCPTGKMLKHAQKSFSNEDIISAKLFHIEGFKAVVTGRSSGIGLMVTQALTPRAINQFPQLKGFVTHDIERTRF
jgi:hypothetical protein